MFVVLRVISPPKGIFAKSKMKKAVMNSVIQTVSTENGLPFYMLDIPEGMSRTMWETAEKKCGRYASRIVVSRSIPLPDVGKLQRFVPCSMNSALTFNTAAEALKNADIPPDSISITLSDYGARQASELHRILPFASLVRVITAYPERYALPCEKAFREFGASVVIRSCYEPPSKPDIIICCDGRLSPHAEKAAVFSHKSKTFGALHFKGTGTLLSNSHSEVIPESIDSVDFTGAVTELCGGSEYKKSLFREIDVSCKKCENRTPAKCLQCFASGNM